MLFLKHKLGLQSSMQNTRLGSGDQQEYKTGAPPCAARAFPHLDPDVLSN